MSGFVTHDYWYLSMEIAIIFSGDLTPVQVFTDLPVPRHYKAIRDARYVREFIDGNQTGCWEVDEEIHLPSDEWDDCVRGELARLKEILPKR
jgi:hypothetical protein